MYGKEEKLELERDVGLTQFVWELLKIQKKKQGISMAKIVCNLVLEKYGTHKFQADKEGNV